MPGIPGPPIPPQGPATFAPPSDFVPGIISNPPFDSRSSAIGAVDANGSFIGHRQSVSRGHIITDSASLSPQITDFGGAANANPATASQTYLLNFMYNPTSFNHSSTVVGDVPTQGGSAPGQQGGNYLMFAQNTGQSVSFSLLFDRTFETWQPVAGSSPSLRGVLVDIQTLYAMVGMYGGGLNQAATVEQLTPTSPMVTTRVWVAFSNLMSYHGIINSLNVSFVHFTQNMIPVRATVAIGMMLIPSEDPSAQRRAAQGSASAAAPPRPDAIPGIPSGGAGRRGESTLN